jgi:hypothetical protein
VNKHDKVMEGQSIPVFYEVREGGEQLRCLAQFGTEFKMDKMERKIDGC